MSQYQLTSDHPVPFGGGVTVTALDGDTVYYADVPSVSATQNQGSITAGNSVQITDTPLWMRSASVSDVSVTAAVTLPTAITTGTFLGSSQVVRPSGDATGATDLANINTALAASTTSVYLNGNYTINGTILMPSGTTLVLMDAQITLAAASNVPMIANIGWNGSSNPASHDIHVRGIGRAMLNYNGANQTYQTSHVYLSSTLVFVGVTNFSIEGLQYTAALYIHVMLQACSNGRVRDSQMVVATGVDKGWLHVVYGCSNITVDGFTASGTFTDAVSTIASGNTSGGNLVIATPYVLTLTGAQTVVSGVSLRNWTLSASTGVVNPFVDGTAGCGINDIDVENFHNTYTGVTSGVEIGCGPAGSNGASLPNHGSITGIRVKGYTFGGSNHWFLAIDSDLTDFQASDIRANGTVKGLVGCLQAVPGSYFPQVGTIVFNRVSIPTLNSVAALCKIVTGQQVNHLEFNHVVIDTANGPILNNAANVTDLSVRKLRVNTMNAVPFQSTGFETGLLEDVKFINKGAGMTALFSKQSGLGIAQPFPVFTGVDAGVPLPVHNSEVVCSPGLNPTGGATTSGGLYIADGATWNSVVALTPKFQPEFAYCPLLDHWVASDVVGVVNGASVPTLPGRANNIFLNQATGANQPTFVAADATLNNLPSLAFNGTAQLLQNTSLNAISFARPWTMFMVYYFTAITGTQYMFDGGGGPTYYLSGGVTHYNYNATALNGVTAVANTGYIACFAQGPSSSGYLGENKTAFASLATGTTGTGTPTMSGVTLAATPTPSNWAAIHVAELIVYSGLVSSADYASVVAGLSSKYAITTA